MNNEIIKDSMFVKAEVAADEKEHIAAPASSMIADAWARLRKNKAAVVSLFILIVIILLAILAPIFSKYDFAFTDYSNVYSMPTKEHIFGCDQFGRDLWTRVWMGTRISLMIALVAAVLDLVVGVLYGAVSALLGGRVDAIMQRIIEILVGIPSLIIVILFLMAFPAGVGTIIAALSITGWVNMARLVRAEILKLKNQEFVMASHVLGSNNFYIIMKDLIPNTVGNSGYVYNSECDLYRGILKLYRYWSCRTAGITGCSDQWRISGSSELSSCTGLPGNRNRADYGML